jgi:predicted DNA-binding protein
MAKKTVQETPKTTTIRVDARTHKRIVKLSETTGRSIVDLIRSGVDALERKQFMDDLGRYYVELRKDPERLERETREDMEWQLGAFNSEGNDESEDW